METKAVAKNVRMSPRKVRRVLDLIRGKGTVEALTILRFTNLRAAQVVSKLVASAMANAEHNHQVDPRTLVVTATWADGGPTLKRFQPHAQGRAFPIMRRSSHVTVVVGSK